MALDFAALKNNKQQFLDKLNQEINKMNSPQGNDADARFWQPTVDIAGNGMATIRLLPAPEEEIPYVRVWSHGFQGPTGLWYIENSRTTIRQGEKDPLSEYNSVLWNSSTDDKSDARTQARKQKRKLTFISNILVMKDSAKPENEGKVFLFRYGKKIWDKVNAAMNPEFDDETPINPFDVFEGADFKLKIRMVEGYRNYDKSEFSDKSAIDEKYHDAISKGVISLKEFVSEANFKSYDDLKARLQKVLALDVVNNTVKEHNVVKEPKAMDPTVPFDVKENVKTSPSDDTELEDLLKRVLEED